MSYNIEKHTALVKSSVIDIIASNCTSKFKTPCVIIIVCVCSMLLHYILTIYL